jgi:hypothetical protein
MIPANADHSPMLFGSLAISTLIWSAQPGEY